MKKYKCNTDQLMYLTKGKIYECEPHKNGLHVWVTMDNGERDCIHPDWLDLIEEPMIKVDSEWITKGGKSVRIKYIGHTYLLYEDLKNSDEKSELISFFKAAYKPKPKTVTMYFYKDCLGLVHSYSTPMPKFGEHLFTKEIEL